MDTLEALSPIEAISSYEINQRKNQLPETHEAYDKGITLFCNMSDVFLNQ